MAKKLISRQTKPAVKKVKKYSLAGYNLSGVSQAPQASYYLGQSAAEEAGETQNVALQSLKETEDQLKKYNEDLKKQQEDAIKQSSMELGKLAFNTGKDIVAKKAAEQAARSSATSAGKSIATSAAPGVATTAAKSGFMAGVGSYGQPIAAALSIGGNLLKNTGGDDNAATFTQQEQNRYALANTVQRTGEFAGYGSVFGPVGTLIGAGLGLGYGVYDSIKDNKEAKAQANDLANSNIDQMAAANNAFINSKMMDTYKGGNQMARYGGSRKYFDGGMTMPGDPIKKKPGETTTTPSPPPTIDWSNPGATLSVNGVAAPSTPAPTSTTKRYQAGNRVLNVTTEDPTLQEGYEAPVGNAEINTDQVSLGEAGKFIGNAIRGGRKYELNTIYEQFRADNPGKVTSEQINQFIKDNGLKFQDFQNLDKDWRSTQWKAAGYGKDGTEGNSPFGNPAIIKGTMGGNGCYGGTCPGESNPTWTRRNGGYEFGGTYNDIGGTRYVNGGKIKPIPNSNDVEYLGNTHEEGGIKLDARTEVEDRETGTKINGNQYFFSRVLKTDDGSSYAEAHKAVASNPSIDPISKKNIIKGLAREQEVDAGRDPKQVAKYGGMQMYEDGGKKKDPKKPYKPNYTLPEEQAGLWSPKFEYITDPVTGELKIVEVTPPKKLSEKEQFAKDLAERERVVLNQKDLDNTSGMNPYNLNPKYNEPPMDPKKLDLSKTWLEEHPGFLGGLAQLAGPAYAMLKPYQKTKGMAMVEGAAAPKLARVDKSGEIEDARRQQNAMNTYLKNTNLGPGKIIAMQSVASKTADEIRKISESQDRENRAIKNAEAQIAAEVSGRNQAAQLEASKANMMADINQNQYVDERNLGVAEALGKGISGMSMDQRKLDMQYLIARGLDKTGSLGRYEIMEQLRKQSKDPKSPVYQKSEQELQQIASELGYKVVEVIADDKEEKRLGGMARKYTSRLGDLSTKRNTTAKQSI